MTEKATRTQIKELRLLIRDKKFRDSSGQFAVEGEKAVMDMMAKGIRPEKIFYADPRDNILKRASKRSRTEFYLMSSGDMEKVSSLKTPQGIIAVLRRPVYKARDLFSGADLKRIIVAESIQDPGNLGGIVRSAVAFGMDAVLLCGETADPYGPKAIRGSSGTVLDIPVVSVQREMVAGLAEKGYYVMVGAAGSEGSVPIDTVRSPEDRFIIVLGSEGRGVSGYFEKMAGTVFNIPIREKAESLNVGAAAAVAMYVFRRKNA